MSTQERPRRLVTVDEYMRLDDDQRYELIDGELLVTPRPFFLHQEILARLLLLLKPHVDARRLGIVAAEIDVILSRHDVVAPDLIFVVAARAAIIRACCRGVPDLAVEILSPKGRTRDLVKKRALYARYGVPHYWIVDPENREIIELVLRSDRYVERSRVAAGAFRPEIFPDLAIDVDALFDAED